MKKPTTHGILPKKYFLDKNFMPLIDVIEGKLKNRFFGGDNVRGEVLRDIVSDVLLELKPKYKQVK